MDLALGCPGSDGSPTHQIGNVLRRNHVEILDPGRHPQRTQFEQEFSSDPQAGINLEASVEMGVVDQALPANGCTRLLEINTHDNQKIRGQTIPFIFQLPGILESGLGIVYRAGPHDDQEAIVRTMQNAADGLPRGVRDLRSLVRERILAENDRRRIQFLDLRNAQVVCLVLRIFQGSRSSTPRLQDSWRNYRFQRPGWFLHRRQVRRFGRQLFL